MRGIVYGVLLTAIVAAFIAFDVWVYINWGLERAAGLFVCFIGGYWLGCRTLADD